MVNKELVKFIKESRKRGFDDLQIREPLIKHGWPVQEIEEAFNSVSSRTRLKNQVFVYLGDDLLNAISKRAKKNMFSISEQVEDILRRSCVNMKKKKLGYDDKLDDVLVRLFSRRKYKKNEKASS